MRSALLGGTLLVAAILVLLGVASSLKPNATHHYRLSGSYPEYSVEDLLALTDAVAIVTPKGDPTVHWNSADNTPWALGDVGRRSFIYADQPVSVERLLSGELPGELVVRSVGGIVGDYELEFEEAPVWDRNVQVLVLLRSEKTPTKEGVEVAWTVVRSGHGVFTQSSDGLWKNPLDISIAEEDVRP